MFGVATAYTRIAADRHYFTDTLAGAAIGMAAGAAPPLLFHRPVAAGSGDRASVLGRATLTAMPVRGGQMVSLGWLF
jgi:membrane-associated phospholipid phosphatase